MSFEKSVIGVYCREDIDTRYGIVPIKVWGQTENDASNNFEIELRNIARLDAMDDKLVIATILRYYSSYSTSEDIIYRLPKHIDNYLKARFASL